MTPSRFSLLLFALAVVVSAGCEPTKGSAPSPSASTPEAVLDENASCPKRFQDLPATGHDNSCLCPAADLTGQVWGSGIYTDDSTICAAAVHAGAIGPKGGRVKARSAPGCATYLGSSNNRVTTSPKERQERSFYFPSVSDGKCAPEPKR